MKRTTPIREALLSTSKLKSSVKDGLSAVSKPNRRLLDEDLKEWILDSLDLDAASEAELPQSNRWDYLLGHASRTLIGLEPHGAIDKEIKVVVKKRRESSAYLRSHLKNGQKVLAWLWVQSSGAGFSKTGKSNRALAQEGIDFVGKQLLLRRLEEILKSRSKLKKRK